MRLAWTLWALGACAWAVYLLVLRDWSNLAVLGVSLLSSGIICTFMVLSHRADRARMRGRRPTR